MNKILQKEINDEKITNTNWQFTQSLDAIKLTTNERNELQSYFNDLLDIANDLNK